MGNESGTWIMRGMAWDDPYRVRSAQELVNWVNGIGFLPLFANEVAGFSAEEHTASACWWCGDAGQDPWEWREQIARGGEVAYGKFFGKKSGFVSKEWLPVLANYRRDGYDFDARWEDGLAKNRDKKIMDQFEGGGSFTGLELKRRAGFGKGGEKNFAGIITDLQMQTYLVIKDFRRKVNKRGGEYGMPVSVYARPEDLWGYELMSSAYREKPEDSKEKIFAHIQRLYPNASEEQLKKVLK